MSDDQKVIPVYVPLSKVDHSIGEYIFDSYLEHETKITSFRWIKNDFAGSSYHMLILLDGLNELEIDVDAFKSEIENLKKCRNITLIITSRNPNCNFENMTEISLCELNREQIKEFLGGHEEYLPKENYEGMLTNPFMLETVIKAFAGDLKQLASISQVSKEMVLQKFLGAQIEKRGVTDETKIYLNIVFPLAIMELDQEAHSGDTIDADPKSYKWEDFSEAVLDIQKNIRNYKGLMDCYISGKDDVDYVEKISTASNRPNMLVDALKSLEVFDSDSQRGVKVNWDHEIYRDYFTARGYAIYSAYNDDAEDCIYHLAKQINYRFPEPDHKEPNVSAEVRGYHIRKAQMFIDMVDTRIKDEFSTSEILGQVKKTAIYRRLTRDVAMIYEDLKEPSLVSAAELSLNYYSDLFEHYDRESKFDYKDKSRRYADVAYSFSSLAYNFNHKAVPKDKKTEYLDKAAQTLNKSKRFWEKLEEEMPDIFRNKTVRDDRLKYHGNWASYYMRMADQLHKGEEKDSLLKNAREMHEANLAERIQMREEIVSDNGNTELIDRNIAQSYIGIGTTWFKQEQFPEAIQNNKEAVHSCENAIESIKKYCPDKEKERLYGVFIYQITAYRNISGGYAHMKSYSEDDVLDAIQCFTDAYNIACEQHIYTCNRDLGNNYREFLSNLTDEQKSRHKEAIRNIDKQIEILEVRNLN